MSELYKTAQPAHVEWAESTPVRSINYRRLDAASTVTSANGGKLVSRIHSNDRELAEQASVIELTLMPRAGFRGVHSVDVLANAGLPIPARPNTAAASANGEWVLRLSQTEYWILGSPDDLGAAVAALPATMADTPAGCYPLFCMDSHAWMMITGPYVAEVMAKLSAVDMRDKAFPLGSIAQTSIARINGIMVKQQYQGMPAISILCDVASSDYLWTALMDAVQEFGGASVGMNVLTSAVTS